MPLICIGPVCIPISALLPILAYALGPIWRRLPPHVQDRITDVWDQARGWMQAKIWDPLGWTLKEESREPATKAEDAQTPESLRKQLGTVVALHSVQDWEAALALSVESPLALVVDFTADWCKPCQALKPIFAALAAQHKQAALFVKVDVDELEEVSTAAKVMAMPTIQVYKQGAIVDKTTGARTEAITTMLDAALSPK